MKQMMHLMLQPWPFIQLILRLIPKQLKQKYQTIYAINRILTRLRLWAVSSTKWHSFYANTTNLIYKLRKRPQKKLGTPSCEYWHNWPGTSEKRKNACSASSLMTARRFHTFFLSDESISYRVFFSKEKKLSFDIYVFRWKTREGRGMGAQHRSDCLYNALAYLFPSISSFTAMRHSLQR